MQEGVAFSRRRGLPGAGGQHRGRRGVPAGPGVGLDPNPDVGMDWEEHHVLRPDPARFAAVDPGFRTYDALYPALRPVFDESA